MSNQNVSKVEINITEMRKRKQGKERGMIDELVWWTLRSTKEQIHSAFKTIDTTTTSTTTGPKRIKLKCGGIKTWKNHEQNQTKERPKRKAKKDLILTRHVVFHEMAKAEFLSENTLHDFDASRMTTRSGGHNQRRQKA